MLDTLFRPRSIAIIGASANPLSIGNRILTNLINYRFNGPIYPIHPQAPHVKNIKCYKSILDVPDEVDLAHIIIKNTMVAGALEECAKKGVKTVIINTSGFKEIGQVGAKMESEIAALGKKLGIRIFGPNCQGVMNTDPDVSLYSNFTFAKIRPGNISLVFQGGGLAEVVNNHLAERNVGIRMYASNGNACDISIPEIMQYYGQDEGTKVIIVHLESLDRPAEFIDVASKITKHKPILAIKSGITPEGAKAVSSHTGGMMEQDTTIDIVFEKCGILRFRSEAELCDAAHAFATQPIPKGRNVAVMTNAGSPAIVITDECIEAGLSLPETSAKTQNILRENLFATASVGNPVDMMATASPKDFAITMKTLLAEDQMNSLIISMVTPFFVDCEGIAREIARLAKETHKTIIANVMTNEDWAETLRIIREAGIPTYYFPESAARALAAMVKYNNIRNRKEEPPTRFDVDRNRAEKILSDTAKDAEGFLSPADVFHLLSCYGIPVVKSGKASLGAPFKNDRDRKSLFQNLLQELSKIAKDTGYPVALKIEAPDIIHKTEAGGVALNIRNQDELAREFERMNTVFGEKAVAYHIQEYLVGGHEVIVGAAEIAGAGHSVAFGLGGIYVETFKDVVFKMAPVSKSEAEQMIESVKAYPILKGTRGQKGVDIPILVEIIQRVSQLVTDFPAIKELDLNPIIAYDDPQKTTVVDARIRL